MGAFNFILYFKPLQDDEIELFMSVNYTGLINTNMKVPFGYIPTKCT